MGVRADLSDVPGLLRHSLGPGTANFDDGPAMSRETAIRGLETGIEIVDELYADGIDLLAIGEMGIGNTTAASAITSAITRVEPELATGRGTGIDEPARRRKIEIVERALRRHAADLGDPIGVLAAVGGFEIAGLAGLLLGAAARRLPVLLDGFITGAAALIAGRLCPDAIDGWIASHRSSEPGHRVILDRLGLRPLLELDLRLGEGTGAVLAMPLVESALRILAEMATFDSAGVADTGA
jgi:nicotinate-nucleotide--dimethylbenzimidazole phosphoribosyltransferase